MPLSGKQLSVCLFFVMFVYSGVLKILNFDKKVDVLGKKTMLPAHQVCSTCAALECSMIKSTSTKCSIVA